VYKSSNQAVRRDLLRYVFGALIAAASASPASAGQQQIDTARSTVTVFVYKSGLFSAFADDHVIKAPIASGSMAEDAPARVELAIHAADLTVTDPSLAADRRAEVQARMVSADVLDVARFPEITFASTSIQHNGPDRWTVAGQLTLHGQTRAITFPVTRVNEMYRGDAQIRQRDFGIEPIRIAGGTVKVKDEVKVTFEIYAASAKE
jgi:polyisoprenoid-binding protein YceI